MTRKRSGDANMNKGNWDKDSATSDGSTSKKRTRADKAQTVPYSRISYICVIAALVLGAIAMKKEAYQWVRVANGLVALGCFVSFFKYFFRMKHKRMDKQELHLTIMRTVIFGLLTVLFIYLTIDFLVTTPIYYFAWMILEAFSEVF